MAIRNKQTFTRATIIGAATKEGMIRALQDLPKGTVLREVTIVDDFVEDDLRPTSFEAEVEWKER